MLKVGQTVETINGVGIIEEIRNTNNSKLYPDGFVYLIRTLGSPALGCGYSDIYTIEEIHETQI